MHNLFIIIRTLQAEQIREMCQYIAAKSYLERAMEQRERVKAARKFGPTDVLLRKRGDID